MAISWRALTFGDAKGKMSDMKILAIDPGTTESAYVLLDSKSLTLLDFAKIRNEELASLLKQLNGGAELVIEQVKSYGMPMSDDLLTTCVWTGRFIEAYGHAFSLMPRKTVVSLICGSSQAGDKNVRQEVINRFSRLPNLGGGVTPAIGTKNDPGPLYGVSRDVWSAIGLALAFEQQRAANMLS